MADITPHFIDNRAVKGRETQYDVIAVNVARVLGSLRESLFAFEWMKPDGRIKPADELIPAEQVKRAEIERLLTAKQDIERPVLGIGMLDNIEIGAGRAAFLTLAALGAKTIAVHVPKSHAGEFTSFAATEKQSERAGEHGNVLYYILLSVALLAALSFAVAQSGRSSVGTLTADQQRLLGAEIIDYGDSVAKAATQLRLRGVTFAQLRFASPSLSATYGVYNAAADNEIFNPEGGGINVRQPPAKAMVTPGDYIFTAANGVNQVGTTCASATCSDLLLLAGPLRVEVCQKINDLLGVGTQGAAPPTVATADITSLFAGTATYVAAIANADLNGKTAACFERTSSSEYYYYQVLMPQ